MSTTEREALKTSHCQKIARSKKPRRPYSRVVTLIWSRGVTRAVVEYVRTYYLDIGGPVSFLDR